SPGSAPAVDLDLDDMLDGLEQDTRAYPESVPRMVSPIRTARPRSIPAAARASEPPPGTRVTARPGAPSQPPQQPTLSAAPPPAVELTISSAPPPRASEPSTEGVDESSRPTPLPTSVVPTPAPPAAPLASPPVVPPPAASRPTPA